MKYEYKSEKVWSEGEISRTVQLEGAFGWKPIFMTPVVVAEAHFDASGQQQFRQINYHIFFERQLGKKGVETK